MIGQPDLSISDRPIFFVFLLVNPLFVDSFFLLC